MDQQRFSPYQQDLAGYGGAPRLGHPAGRIIACLVAAGLVGAGLVAIFWLFWILNLPDALRGFVLLLLGYGYFNFMEGTYDRTVGKSLLVLRVVNERGAAIRMRGSLMRNILRIVDMLLAGLVGLILIAFTGKRQRIGDMAAKTLVIRG